MTDLNLGTLAPPTGLAAFRAPAGAVKGGAAAKAQRLHEVSTQFESLFLSMLVKEMTAGLTGLFGEGAGSEIYRGLFQSTLGDSLAGKGFGLAAQIEKSLGPPPATIKSGAASHGPLPLTTRFSVPAARPLTRVDTRAMARTAPTPSAGATP
ncbi:MAG: rod-binding protein [Planctomycetes bacterium]|nr:rod-binding protein [Planctomycetota bacterium]MBI3843035.1 rod-binding protein [Planctomycetota bacterium]